MEKLTVYIISEDSSKNSFEVVNNIVSKSLRSIEQNIDYNLIDFNNRFNIQSCIKGTGWKERKPRKPFIDLIEDLMDELLDDNVFFFWHFDGDRKWSNRDSSQNRKSFKKLLSDIKLRDPRLDINKVFLLMPFYSIESWLFPFITDKTEGYLLSSTDNADFDEIFQIKDNSGIKNSLNLDLSNNFNHNTLFSIKKSYYESYRKILNNKKFITKLNNITFPWSPKK